jgi:hypothetical protein
MIHTYAIIALAILLAGGGFKLGMDVKDAQWLRIQASDKKAAEVELKAAQDKAAAAQGDLLTAIRNIKIVNTTRNVEVKREIEKQVYMDCKLPPSGVVLSNRIVDEANAAAAGRSDGAVYAPPAPAGRSGGVNGGTPQPIHSSSPGVRGSVQTYLDNQFHKPTGK